MNHIPEGTHLREIIALNELKYIERYNSLKELVDAHERTLNMALIDLKQFIEARETRYQQRFQDDRRGIDLAFAAQEKSVTTAMAAADRA